MGEQRLGKLTLGNFINGILKLGKFTQVYLPLINLPKVFYPLYIFHQLLPCLWYFNNCNLFLRMVNALNLKVVFVLRSCMPRKKMCNKKVYVQDNILPQPPKKLHRLGLQPDPAWVISPSLGYFIQLGQL